MPLDSAPTISPDVREKLLTAATLLRKHGRCKGVFNKRAPDGVKICLANALATANGCPYPENLSWESVTQPMAAAEELGKCLGFVNIMAICEFNNNSDDATVLARLEGVH